MVETHQSHRPRGLPARFGVFETFGRREKKCGRPKNDQRIGRYQETDAERASGAIDSEANFKNKSKFRSVMSNKKLALSIFRGSLCDERDTICVVSARKIAANLPKTFFVGD